MVFLSVATGTMVNVALPWITDWSGAPPAVAGWVVSGYLLTFGVFNVVNGRLSDRLGIRRVYLGGMLVFGLAGLASALSPSLPALVVVRVLQGMGAAAIPALGVTLLTRLLPPEERGGAMGLLMATVGVSASISPFLGGLLVQALDWRGVFVAPTLALFALPLALRLLPESLDAVEDSSPFDAVGAVLLTAGAGAVLVGADLVRANPAGPLGLGLLLGGPALLGASWAWSLRAPAPFLPPALLRIRAYRALLLTGAFANALRFGTVVLVPLVLRSCFDASPTTIGATLVPGAVVLALTGRASGRLAVTRGTRFMSTVGVLGLIGACLLSAALLRLGSVGLGVGMACFGLAFSAVQPSMLTGLGQVLPRPVQAVGNGLYFMAFFLGGALGVAAAMGTLSLQAEGAPPLVDLRDWLGPLPHDAGRTLNALLVLCAVGALALPFLRLLPGPRQEAPG